MTKEDGLIRSEEGWIEGLELRTLQRMMGCGIYEVGDPDRCYVRLFVSDGGFVMPMRGHLTEDDALTLFVQGFHEGKPPVDPEGVTFE